MNVTINCGEQELILSGEKLKRLIRFSPTHERGSKTASDSGGRRANYGDKEHRDYKTEKWSKLAFHL
ncbi:MAG TPA: hypothetical protein PKC89_05435 [Pyrinomonadaceae bacterium]|nr:hypothetical protein [Pyrinomonadaceae bacterium]